MAIFTIEQEQQNEYFTRGFTGIKNALSPELLKRLQDMATRFENDIMTKHKQGDMVYGSCVVNDPVGDRLTRYNEIYARDIDTTLDLLSSPPMMAIFRDICGRGAVPIQMDILYKHQHPHPVVLWHQEMQNTRVYPYLNIGIFLDDSLEDDGCLSYVPNTQHEQQDIQVLSSKHGWDIPESIEFPAMAGDINIQDIMILHGSKPKRTQGVRRTIYVEIRPYEGILEDNAQSKEWAELKKRFMGLVIRRADPQDWPKEWKDDYPSDLGSDEDEIRNIVSKWEAPIPSNYAIFPVEHPAYPVPADMR